MKLRDLRAKTLAQAQNLDVGVPSFFPQRSATPPIQPVRQERAPVAETEAAIWLREKLTWPQRIASLIAAWVGERDGCQGRWIDDLMEARWTLGVQAYEGEDGRAWWRLPHVMMQ